MKITAYGRTFEVDAKRVRGGRELAAQQVVPSPKTIPTQAPALSSPPLSLCFTLWGTLPGGKNQMGITRKGKRYPKKRFAEWREASLKQCPPVAGPFTGYLHLIVDYVKGDLRRRDMPGMLDALCHLFEKAGYLLDDKQIVQQTWTPFPLDRKRPRCTVTLSPIERNLDEEE